VWQEVIEELLIVSDIMITSKGRDKVFSLAQYLIDLYVKCMTYSKDYGSLVK
jgi:hypothetical protein